MKKAYESPKAVKTEFNYSDVVVASGIKCGNTTTYSQSNDISLFCQEVIESHVVRDVY